jgi:hypothetical protein
MQDARAGGDSDGPVWIDMESRLAAHFSKYVLRLSLLMFEA